MRLLVCGGRELGEERLGVSREVVEAERRIVRAVLGGMRLSITYVIHGCATGADSIARYWAQENGIPESGRTFEADWTGLGRKAGPIRNQRMIDEGKPDMVIAFKGGRGTADMVRRARKAGVPVTEKKW